MEKMLPQNIDAEKGLLGSLLFDSQVLDEVMDIVTAQDFYRDAHRLIFDAITRLHAKREGIDFVTVSNELESECKLEQIDDGTSSYLLSLINAVPTSSHAQYYAEIIATKAAHRRRIHAATKIAALSYEEADDAQTQSEQLISEVQYGSQGDFISIADVMRQCNQDFDSLKDHEGSIIGVPTGFHGLDVMFGGMQKSDLLLLAGRPGEGKTTLAQNIVHNAMLDYGMRVAFFSLEMSKKQLAHRFIAMLSKIDSQRIRLNQIDETGDEWDRISWAMGKLSDGHLWIDDTAALDVDVMRSRIRRLHASQQIDLVVVDYLQQMHATVGGKRPVLREQEVSEIACRLKQVARELNVPVLALAQMSRAVENRADHIPQLSDLRESGRLEQEADIVMFLHRDESAKGTIDVLVEKQRNGPTGTVRLGFEPRHTRFFNIDDFNQERS